MKKILPLLLAVVMVLSLGITASAADSGGPTVSLAVTDSTGGHEGQNLYNEGESFTVNVYISGSGFSSFRLQTETPAGLTPGGTTAAMDGVMVADDNFGVFMLVNDGADAQYLSFDEPTLVGSVTYTVTDRDPASSATDPLSLLAAKVLVTGTACDKDGKDVTVTGGGISLALDTAEGTYLAQCTHDVTTVTITETTADHDGEERVTCAACGYTYYKTVTYVAPNPTGTCGDDLTWEFDLATGALTISGTGAMDDDDLPWGNYSESIKIITVGSGVTSISLFTFEMSSALTSITVDAANTQYSSVDGVLFNKDATKLVAYPSGRSGSYTIPDGVTSIGEAAFFACSGLTGVTIPNGVSSIGDSAFRYCEGLTSVTIPNGATNIGDLAFDHCSNLTSVTIPNSVTSIGTDAFLFCTHDYVFGSSDLVIHGAEGSYAQTYADNNGITFAACTHNYTFETTTAATCTADGVRTYTCSVCGNTYTEPIPATGHSYDTGVVTKPATVAETGIRTYTCSVCKATCTETIPLTVSYSGTGWAQDSAGNWYYFVNSKLQTNLWVQAGSYWYYVKADGKMADNEVLTIGSATYCFAKGGAMATGWQKIDGHWSYFNSAMKTGWLSWYGSWYYLDTNGVMVTGLYTVPGDTTFYFNASGVMQTGWMSPDGNKHWYYFGSDGRMVVSNWVYWNNSWYYMGSNGFMVTGLYSVPGDATYCFSSSGVMQTGWISQDGGETWRYFGSDGRMAVNSWVSTGGSWYYVGSDGIMLAGGTYTIADGTTSKFASNGAWLGYV